MVVFAISSPGNVNSVDKARAPLSTALISTPPLTPLTVLTLLISIDYINNTSTIPLVVATFYWLRQ